MKKELQKAHEQSVVTIGEHYMVAHVNVKNPYATPIIDIDVPIIPIWHNDKKHFKLDASHYHIDGRFLSNSSKQSKIWRVKDGLSTGIISDRNGNILSEIFYKKKKCIRLYTGVPSVSFHAPKFIENYTGKSCKGKKCPHWGATMNEIGGILICPMHRLKGNIEKEIIIG